MNPLYILIGLLFLYGIMMTVWTRNLKEDERDAFKRYIQDCARLDLEKAALEKQLSDLKKAKKSQFN